MSEQMKAFLAKLSADEKLAERLKAATNPDDVLALAKELGCSITLEDIQGNPADAELSEDELEAVSGGTRTGGCACMLAGGGGGKNDAGATYGCACAAYGQGGSGKADDFTCWCAFGGAGNASNIVDSSKW